MQRDISCNPSTLMGLIWYETVRPSLEVIFSLSETKRKRVTTASRSWRQILLYQFKEKNIIQDILAHYSKQADGLCVNFKQPCLLLEKPQTVGLSKHTIDEWEVDR